MATRNLPKRPRPIPVVIAGVCTAGYIAMTVIDFMGGHLLAGFIWAACSLVWAGYIVPSWIGLHRSRVRTWQKRVETIRILDELDAARAARWPNVDGGR